MLKKITFLALLSYGIRHNSIAQDDLLELAEKSSTPKRELTTATFKGTRLINLHTIETLGKGSLDVRISHRFGDLSTGAYNWWGLDGPANIRLGVDYSLTDRFALGIGRSSYGKLYDGYLKYRLLRQTINNEIPLSISGLMSVNVIGEKDLNKPLTGIDRYANFSDRLVYMFQLMVARKFSKSFTLQLSPIVVHYNLVTNLNDKNDLLAVALSGRLKLTKRTALTSEYIARASYYSAASSLYHNSASIGVDIETGGHVFQLFISNSLPINETQLIPYTSSSWSKGQVRLGFNISRYFGIRKRK